MLHRENSRLVKRSYDLLVWIQYPDEHLLRSAIAIRTSWTMCAQTIQMCSLFDFSCLSR